MNKYIMGLLLGASFAGLTACNDFLSEEPVDKIIPEISSLMPKTSRHTP